VAGDPDRLRDTTGRRPRSRARPVVGRQQKAGAAARARTGFAGLLRPDRR